MQEEQQVARKEFQDHVEFTVGTPSKGLQTTLKTYYNALDIDDAQKRIENTLKIRQYLMDNSLML